ncbi:MAG: hypothetical protein ACTHK7_15440 [Aureliella sp.]
MAPASSPTAQKKRRPLIVRMAVWALYALGVVGVLLVSVLIWLVVRDRIANSQLQQRVAELKEAGLPYDVPSLAQYYERLMVEHGADQRDSERWLDMLTVKLPPLAEDAEEAGLWKFVDEPIPPPSQPWPEEAKTQTFLDTWAKLRGEARQLALEDRVVPLPIDFEARPPEFALIAQMRQLWRLFAVEAQVAIRKRDSAATRDAILAIFGCSRAIQWHPLFVPQLMSIADEDLAGEQLRYALEADVLSTDDLKLIQARIDKRQSFAEAWKISIYGERGSALPAFRVIGEDVQQARGAPPRAFFSLRSRDALTFVQFVDQAAALATDDLNEFYAGLTELDKTMWEKHYYKNSLARWDAMLTFLWMPAFAATRDSFVRREMLARQATLGIGLRLYEDEHGALPEKLEQLSELGLDLSQLTPIGDKPFGYRRDESHATLWSFSLLQHKSTPAEPPSIDESSGDATEQRRAEENRRWVWEFPSAPPR